MKYFLIIFLGFVPSYYSCQANNSLHESFNAFKDLDYSEFADMSIVNRKGVNFVTYHGITYKIKRSSFTNKISSIEKAYSQDTSTQLTKEDTDHIEKRLNSFDRFKVQALSVDIKGNVLLSLPWEDGCTYYFLKLSPESTLMDIKKQHYRFYAESWYTDKECAEK